MTLAYDGASPFSLAAAKRNGGILVTGYIIGRPGGFYPINKARVAQIHALGMGFLPNWERAADWGRTATTTDASTAGRESLAACRVLGVPDDGSVAVAFSFDYQIPTSDYARCAGLVETAHKAMGGHYRAIVYGQSGFIRYLAEHGQPGPHWLMGSTWGLSDYDVGSPHVGLIQMHDAHGNWLNSQVAGTDVNTLTHPETLRAWWPTGSKYGTDTITATPLEDDVTPEQIQEIAHAVWAYGLTQTDPANGKKEKHPAWQYLTAGWAHGKRTDTNVNNPKGGVLVRVARVQAAVKNLGGSK